MFHDCGGNGHFHLYLLSDPSQVWPSYGPTLLSAVLLFVNQAPFLQSTRFMCILSPSLRDLRLQWSDDLRRSSRQI